MHILRRISVRPDRSVKGMIDHERERRQQAKEAADEKASTEKVENDS